MKKQYVVFENEGEIDIQSITTFGISVKETDNPIGYFGTGLKYAISIILRNHCDIIIYSGETILKFKSENRMIRNKSFKMVTMNDADLPFTTELGKNWEIWQAFREVYCNCLDEKGKTYINYETPKPEQGKTFVIVSGDLFLKEFKQKDVIVLNPKKEPILDCVYGQVYNMPSQNIYYRGVNVEKMEQRSILTYNITSKLSLTEDRTLKNNWDAKFYISQMFTKLTEKSLLRKGLSNIDCYEGTLDISEARSETDVSKEFIEVMEEAYELNRDNFNKSSLRWFKNYRNKSSIKSYTKSEMNKIEQTQMDKCIRICKNLYEGFDHYPILVVKTLGENTMALADRDNGRIIISKRCFTLGTKYLFSTLIEEFIHLDTGYGDHTRELQTYLFDTISTLVETYVEGEPI